MELDDVALLVLDEVETLLLLGSLEALEVDCELVDALELDRGGVGSLPEPQADSQIARLSAQAGCNVAPFMIDPRRQDRPVSLADSQGSFTVILGKTRCRCCRAWPVGRSPFTESS